MNVRAWSVGWLAVGAVAMGCSSGTVLTILPSGTGAGVVTSNPVGISCGTTCSHDFGKTQVTLTAQAAAGSVFAGWSSACTGTDACVVNLSQVDTVVGAVFNTAAPPGPFDTSLSSTPDASTAAGDATFTFDSVPTGASTFTCQLDAQPAASCTSPATYSNLGIGPHTFLVTAGNGTSVDPTPATFTWTLTEPTLRLPGTETAFCTDTTQVITCPGGPAGQTGDYRLNVPVYETTSGTVRDPVTGLVWARVVSSTSVTAAQADAHCAQLGPIDSVTGWRLPSRYELLTILDIGRTVPPLPVEFNPADNSFLWTSTPVAGQAGFRWSVNTNYPLFVSEAETDTTASHLALCVSGTALVGGVVQVDADTVANRQSGLIWQKATLTASSWTAALAACEGLTLSGHADWRLPSSKELGSLFDVTRTSPALDPLFVNDGSPTLWTSTPEDTVSAYAFSVTDGSSFMINHPIADVRGVRCVRSNGP